MPASDTSEVFRLASGETQKEPLSEVNLPMLTWYRSFLIPGKQDIQQGRYSKMEMKLALDKVITELLRAVKLKDIYPTVGNHAVLFQTCVDLGSLNEVEPPTKQHKRIVHGDERTIIIIFHWSDRQEGSFDIVLRVQLRANVFNLTILAHPNEHSGFAIDQGSAFRHLIEKFWAKFALWLRSFPSLRVLFDMRQFSIVFADVRGVLISVKPTEDDDWAHSIIRSIQPYLAPEMEQELTASYLLDGKALTLSTVGSRSLHVSEKKNVPVSFLLVVPASTQSRRSPDARELGRLLESIHLVAMFRLAALLDLNLLRTASDQLSQIDSARKKATEDVDRFEKEIMESVETRESLRALRNAMNKISDDFLIGNRGGIGLTFRIESSRYYVSQFHKNLAALKLKEVPGYYRYDEFVERRLGVTFEFIHRLGIRYERALGEMSAIEQSFASIQARLTGITLADIQRDGEFILLSVLVPYYLMAAIGHILRFDEHDPPRVLRVGFATLWACFIIGSFTKWAYTKFGLKRIYRRAVVGAFAICICIAVTFILASVLP